MKIEIRCNGLNANEELLAFVKRRVHYALSSRRDQIDSVRVRLADVGEARDGKNRSCRVQVALATGHRIAAEVMDSDLYIAIHRAVDRAGWTAARRLQREQLRASSTLMIEHHLSAEREPDRAA